MNDASLAQIEAAAPRTSTWLSANAGSGKTRVLTDRVARLLLEGVRPERILCLTYTKAAAMEMQNRLFKRLGEWAMLSDDALSGALIDVGVPGADLDATVLSQARTLFARAIEAPGGLKIQTIHSFCSSVLRRFPLEAGVSPGFTEIDERVQTRLIADLVDDLAHDPNTQEAIDGLASHLTDDEGLLRLVQSVAGRAADLSPPSDWPQICSAFGIDPALTEEAILAQVRVGGEAAVCKALVALLDPENRQQGRLHAVLSAVDWDRLSLADLQSLESVCLTGASAKAPLTAKVDAFGNKAIRTALGPNTAAFNALMERIEAARPLRLALSAARRTHALHVFAAAFLPAYADAKLSRGWLDFDDLIHRTRALLSAPGVAQWVLFRLDGGIDHILVDEAQDTSPDQWDIVARLAEDFAVGEGARSDVERTIFVVGDKKQSIYSFQGADPEGFDRMRAHFAARLSQIDAPFQYKELLHSFRSAPSILQVVDRVAARATAGGVGADVEHRAFFGDKPGRVDLWPVVEAVEQPEPPEWDDPRDLVGDDHHVTRLARQIADQIDAMITAASPITVGDVRRAVTPGDIMILVQRRSPLFRAIISALKAKGLPIAGVDRAQIADPLAVQDLLSLMRFLATPEDDLSLAEVLRSPLGGFSEADLFALAHGRGSYLWRALQERASDWPATVAMLEDLRDQSDFLRPYDLLERVLIKHDGRRRLLARLGLEAEDGIDAILAQALAYERMEVPSLMGFVGWLDSGEVVVKRDLAQVKDQIRVMTVHGAKGLEAPVVILPDTGQRQATARRAALVQPHGAPVLWSAGSAQDAPPLISNELDRLAAAAAAEHDRLLYVAMTRAESWLIVAAAGRIGTTPDASWYGQVQAALQDLGAQSFPLGDGAGLRLQTGDWSNVDPVAAPAAGAADLPSWTAKPAPHPIRDQAVRSPSDLGGAKALPGEAGPVEEAAALRHGRLVHLLLEHLPGLPQPAWAAATPGICALESPSLPSADQTAALDEATAVLTTPDLAWVFAQDALAEVEVAGESAVLGGPVMGVIDRLIVTPERVLVVDFKTNRTVPARPEDVPEGLLRQMGAYSELLAAIYPDRPVETAILWSNAPGLMFLPHDLVSQALGRAATA